MAKIAILEGYGYAKGTRLSRYRRRKHKGRYQRCVGAHLRGRHFRTKRAHRKAMKAAARACAKRAKTHKGKKKRGRR